ncbi:hypothetical protein SH449x_002165 [Pirellulaceae bacterium SH449]
MNTIACVVLSFALLGELSAKDPDEDELSCLIHHSGDDEIQIWVVPNREDVDQQALIDKHWPTRFSLELGVIVKPPRNLKLRTFAISEIAALQSLVTLDLSGATVSDNDIQTLSALPSLESLVLDSTNVTEQGIRRLAKLKSLRFLSVHGCPTTNESLAFLKGRVPGLVVATGIGDTIISIQSTKDVIKKD